MSTMRLKNKDGTWDKVPVLGSYQAVLAANEAATNAQNAADEAENLVASLPSDFTEVLADVNKLGNEKFDKKYVPFVTPKMFGGIGDGESHIINGIDTEARALQNAIDSGKTVVIPSNETYSFSTSIYFNRAMYNQRLINNGTLEYTGDSYGIILTACQYNTFDFGKCNATKNSMVLIRNNSPIIPNGTNQHTVYLNIYFTEMNSTNSCFTFDINNSTYKYINEIRFYNGKFSSNTQYAITFIRDERSEAGYRSIRLTNVAFEGVNYPLKICKNCGIILTNCRLDETPPIALCSYDDVYLTDNQPSEIIWGVSKLNLEYVKDVQNTLIQFFACGITQGTYRIPIDGIYYNKMLYTNGVNGNYIYNLDANETIYDALTKNVGRKCTCRIFRTPVNSSSIDFVLNRELFGLTHKSSLEPFWKNAEYPFNTFIVVVRGNTNTTTNFVDEMGNVIKTVTGENYPAYKIYYSVYGQRFIFEKINFEERAFSYTDYNE